MVDNPKIADLADKLVRELAAQGLLVEAGWQTYRLLCLKVPPHEARDDLREAFMMGAEHIFASMIQMLDPGTEETPGDIMLLSKLDAELEVVRQVLQRKYNR